MKIVKEISLAGISLIALATPSYAQTPEVAENESAEDDSDVIIVTARRRDESIQDVPQVVNAVTAESIEKLNIRKFEDVTALVPGYSVNTARGSAGIISEMRGVSFNSNASGGSTTVEYYLNDAVAFGGTVTTALFDVAQIEVLRGPQGTLRGRATPSGSVNITTRAPNLSEVGGYASTTVDDNGGWNVNGAMNIPIVADKLAVRLAGVVTEDEGDQVRALTNSEDPGGESRALRASVRADPFDGVLVLDFKYTNLFRRQKNYAQVESANQAFPTLFGASPTTIAATDRLGVTGLSANQRIKYEVFNWQAQLNQFGQQLTYVGAVTKGSFRSNDPQDTMGVFATDSGFNYNSQAAFQQFAGARSICQIGYAATVFAPSLCLPLGTLSTGSQVNFENLQETFTNNASHELRLQNEERVAGIFDYVIGGFLYTTESNIPFTARSAFGQGGTTPFFAPGLLPVPTSANIGTLLATTPPTGTNTVAPYIAGILTTDIYIVNPTREESIFGNLTAHIGERTEISGGLRHIWFENDFSQFQNQGTGSGATPPAGTAATVQPTSKQSHTIFTGSIKHNFSDDIMVYASVGSSWRPSRVNPSSVNRALATARQLAYLEIQPETSTSYEAGFKSSLFDRRLRLNVTGFYQKYNNFAYATPTQIAYVNSAGTLARATFVASVPADVKGVEADFSLDVTPNWNIGGVLSFVDGKIKNGVVPCQDANPNDGIADGTSATTAQIIAADPTDRIGSCAISQRSSSLPRWSGTITSEYSQPLNDNMNGYLRGLFSWKGDAIGDPANPYDSVNAFGLLNMFLGLRDADGSWDISLYGKNITNTFRVLTRTPGALATVGQPTTIYGTNSTASTNYFGITATPPREFGINVRFAFGSR